MTSYALYAADLVAIGLLVFGLFLPRHHRPELIVALLTANVGVLAVTVALTSSTIGAGLGLGLFGILSIIRLRSEELGQHEIAYYFASLALGLLGGLDQTPTWADLGLMALVLAAIAVGDHPRVGRRPEVHQVLLDRAYGERAPMIAHLERLLGAEILSAHVAKTDVVNDTTLVTVRYVPAGAGARARHEELTR